MKRLVLALSIFLVISIMFVGCAKPQQSVSPQTPAPEVRVIKQFVAPFGTGTYGVMAGVERIAATDPNIRVSCMEAPGSVYAVQLICSEAESRRWTDHAIWMGYEEYAMAKGGYGSFKAPLPILEDMRILFNYQVSSASLYTMNADLAKDIRNLDGKRVGLGLQSQSGWAWIPETLMREGYGINPNTEYLGPVEAKDALLDGRVDAASVQVYVSGDGKVVIVSQPLIEMESAGRDFYYFNYDKAEFTAALEKAKIPCGVIEIPAGTLPSQTEPVLFTTAPCAIWVHKTFDEDMAYWYVKLMLNNYSQLVKYHATGKIITPETMVGGWPRDKYHPGALKAYDEAKITFPEGGKGVVPSFMK